MFTKPSHSICTSEQGTPCVQGRIASGITPGDEQHLEDGHEPARERERQRVADDPARRTGRAPSAAASTSGNMKMRWYQHSRQGGSSITSLKKSAPERGRGRHQPAGEDEQPRRIRRALAATPAGIAGALTPAEPPAPPSSPRPRARGCGNGPCACQGGPAAPGSSPSCPPARPRCRSTPRKAPRSRARRFAARELELRAVDVDGVVHHRGVHDVPGLDLAHRARRGPRGSCRTRGR